MPVIRQFFHSYLTIIDRYLLREFTLNLLAVTGVLWLIYVATRFSRYLAQAAMGNLPSDVIFTLLGYSSLSVLSLLLPMGAFMGVMLGLGRMNADNELTVIAACGVSDARIMRTITLFSGVIGVIVMVLSLVIVPTVLSNDYELEQRAKMSADTTGMVAGNFKESRSGDWTFYSQKVSDDKQGMDNVFIEINRNARPLLFRAEKGHFDIDRDTGDKYLILENGYRYEGKAGEQDFTIAHYKTHSLLIEKGNQQQKVSERFQTLPTMLLWKRGNPRDIAELQWRSASAIMTVILCLLAMTLSNNGPRKGRYTGFFPAIMIYLIYSNLIGITRAWVTKGVMMPLVGAVWVHITMIMLLIVLLNRQKIKYLLHGYWRGKGRIQQ